MEQNTPSRRATVQPSPRDRGLAMVLVMIALTVGTIITLTFLSSQTTSTAIAHNSVRQVQARAIAEDGMQLVLEYVRDDAAWRDGRTHGEWTALTDLNGGDFRVRFEDEEDNDLGDDLSEPFVVTVEASFDGVVHQISNLVTPQGSAARPIRVMFMSGDSSPTDQDQDQERIDLLRSFGYVVNIVKDEDSQSAYDAAAAISDVVYVSLQTSSTMIGERLNNYPLGIVNERAALQDELGLVDQAFSYSGSTIDITDNAHPITAGFALGEVAILDAVSNLVQSDEPQAAGLRPLAQRVDSPRLALSLIEVGDTLLDGSPSPQRRVLLPWGARTSTQIFDFSLLNANAHRLMRQAIEWAAQTPSGPKPVARWAFDEVAGSVAQESVAGNDGAHFGSPELGRPGVLGGALGLDGVNDGVVIPPAPALELGVGNADHTVSVWVNPEAASTGSFRHIVEKFNAAGERTFLVAFRPEDLRIHYTIRTTTAANLTANTAAQAALQDWTHLVYVKSGQQIRLYMNGALASARSFSGESESSDGPTYINPPASAGFEGRLDDLRIYDVALTDEQILSLFEEATPPEGTPNLVAEYNFNEPAPVTPTLVGHWRLDEPAVGGGAGVAIGTIGRGLRFSRIDSYDSSLGPYGGANVSDEASVSINSTTTPALVFDGNAVVQGSVFSGPGSDPNQVIEFRRSATLSGARSVLAQPVNLAPTPVPAPAVASSGPLDMRFTTTRTLTSDTRFDFAAIDSSSRLILDGQFTVWIDDSLSVGGDAQIEVTPGSRVQIFVGNSLIISDSSRVNENSGDPSALRFVLTSNGRTARLVNNGRFHGIMENPRGQMEISETAELFGQVFVDVFELRDSAQVHVDTALAGVESMSVTARDEVMDNDGTAVGGVTPGAAGRDGTAYRFDGNNSYVEVPHSPAYLLDRGALAFWFNADDLSGFPGLISKDATGFGGGGHLTVSLGGSSLEVELASATDTHRVFASGAVSANTWHHVVVGFGAGGLRLYLDGVLVDTDAYAGGLGTSSGGTGNQEPITFGMHQGASESGSTVGVLRPFEGRLDDVRLYDQNLDADQVADLFVLTDPRAVAPPIVFDSAGQSPAHDLAIADPDRVTWIDGGGLTLDQATVITSGGPVDRLRDTIVATDGLTVEAIFTPANTTQDGPAPIVSYSNGTTSRNFQLGQTQSTYNAQLRTEFIPTGLPQAESGDVLTAGVREHVLFTYDNLNEELRVYRNGNLEVTEPWSGDLDNWASDHFLLLGNATTLNRPWLGTLHRVAIYDQAFNNIQADNVFNGSPPGDGTGGDEGLVFEAEWLESP